MIVLVICIAYVILAYRDISDFEFYLVALALLINLYFIMHKREYFVGEAPAQSAVVQEEHVVQEEGPALDTDIVTYSTLFNMPNDMSSILMPKFNYIISGLKGGSSSSNADSIHYVDASDFYGSKDPDVMKDDLKTNYRDLNAMFLSLSNISPNLYKQTFQTKSN
jgi:hypothetical protein